MIILTLRLNPPASSIQGALTSLETTRHAVMGMAGCLEFSITVDVNPQGGIHLVERWEGEEEFDRHLRSENFKHILELMEISQTPPDLHVFQVEESAGLERVEGVRSRSNSG